MMHTVAFGLHVASPAQLQDCLVRDCWACIDRDGQGVPSPLQCVSVGSSLAEAHAGLNQLLPVAATLTRFRRIDGETRSLKKLASEE